MEEVGSTTEPMPKSQHEPVLPRSAWFSQLMQLRLLLQAKQALDRQEKTHLKHPQ